MTTAVAKPSPAGEFSAMLERSKGQIAKALPRHLTPERMIRMAVTAFSSTPLLQQCAMPTIIGCVVKASELGLELTGPLGHAYMVPRKNKKNNNQWEANFQVGYRGFIDLAYRTGRVKTFCAHEVRAGDNFDYQYGTDPYVIHKPAKDGDGEITHVYAVCIQTNGGIDFEVMTADQVDAHARKFSDSFNSEYSPWKTAWAEMAKKTAIRKLAKRVPLSAEFAKAAAIDEYTEAGVNDTPIMIEGSPPEIPTGRMKLKDLPTNGNGNGHHEEPPQGDANEDEPPTAEQIQFEVQRLIDRAIAAGNSDDHKSGTSLTQKVGAELREMQSGFTTEQIGSVEEKIQEANRKLAAKKGGKS